jgi:hypothetical protein
MFMDSALSFDQHRNCTVNKAFRTGRSTKDYLKSFEILILLANSYF